MKKVTFTKDFKFSPDGFSVIEYKAGETKDVDDECAYIADRSGHLKSKGGAPKNKAK